LSGKVLTVNDDTTSAAYAGGTIDSALGDDQLSNSSAKLCIDVSAVGGTTPQIQFFLYAKINGKNYLIQQSAAITTATRVTFDITVLPRNVLLAWTISGTTPTFTVDAFLCRN
jgi:hypothetical protein